MSFERLAPEGYRKIAENTNQRGDSLAAVYHKQANNTFFIQTQNEKGDGFIGLGPMAAHVFDNLMQIMVDVKDMDKRYMPLE
jgi:hypothetical protein